MKKLFLLISITILFTSFSCGKQENAVTIGKWTADYDSAIKLAQEEKVPVFLNFTGSDWCVWCKLMKENVFSKPEWDAYAKDNLVLVTLDFPKDKSKISEEYQKRNSKLQEQMGVQGYPTYIILDSDGQTRLGQLGAGKEKTAESFISEVKSVLRYSAKGIEKFSSSLSDSEGKKYKNLWKSFRKAENDFQSWVATKPTQTPENMNKMNQFNNELSSLNKKIKEIETEKITTSLSAEQAEKYKTLTAKLESAQNALNNWLVTKPQRTEENTRIYSKYMSTIQNVQNEINAIESAFF